jgi:hypothetical protein
VKEKLLTAAAALVLSVFAVHAWVSLSSGAGVNLVSGVWLALARDCRDGLFYRGLLDEAGYGGTRYFPLFFLLIAGFMRAGLGAVAAGHAASLSGAFVLLSGAWALARALGLPRVRAFAAVPFVIAPYFVQESVFAIRAEPLAAGFVLLGLSSIAWLPGRGPGSVTGPLVLAAMLFTAAAATKPTAVYALAAAIVALLLARRVADAVRLAAFGGLGAALLVVAIWWGSDGRAIEAFRVGALGGDRLSDMLSLRTLTHSISLVASSRVLTVLAALAFMRLIAAPHEWRSVPVMALVGAAATTALVLTSSGTILANQIVDAYVASALYVAWSVLRPRTVGQGRRSGPHAAWAGVLVAVLLWTAGQNVARAAALLRADAAAAASARAAAVERYRACGGRVLAESPLLPILAGDRPVLLDPFAFRVAAAQRPEIRDDMIRRLAHGEFSCVILEYDPATSSGASWYRNVDFGGPVIDMLLESYEYRGSAGGRRFYAPARR